MPDTLTEEARPPQTVSSLDDLLAARASENGNQPFLWTPAQTLTYRQVHDRVERMATGLQERGIEPGDRVVLFMGNSGQHVTLWFALNRIGAVSVPLNTGLTGDLLARAVDTVQPSMFIVDTSLIANCAEVVRSVRAAGVPVYLHSDHRSSVEAIAPDLAHLPSLAEIDAPGPAQCPQVDELAAAVMLFTSGSTGVPKACVLSRKYVLRAGQIHAKYLRLGHDDVLFTPFPLFHIDAATLTVAAAAASGATAALSPRFSASRFWDEVRASNATVFNYMGATANILWKQEPSPSDRDHRVRLAWGVPMPACAPDWQQRFGFPLVEVYGLTDAGVPCYPPLDEGPVPGSCGRVIPEYELRIGDEEGTALPAGSVGEILIRAHEPGLLMNEYFAMPDATRAAMRGGWFHTGDLGRLDDRDNLFFCARGKEVIRRRGENIAASDVERGIDAHPDVIESAAVGVPSDLSEDDIKVFVVRRPTATLTEIQLVEHARAVLPRYMVPRYVELVDALPKTQTQKVERVSLAKQPLTCATWDAEGHEYVRPNTPDDES